MTHANCNEPRGAAVCLAIKRAEELSARDERHSARSWEAAKHVGDLSALATVALTRPVELTP